MNRLQRAFCELEVRIVAFLLGEASALKEEIERLIEEPVM